MWWSDSVCVLFKDESGLSTLSKAKECSGYSGMVSDIHEGERAATEIGALCNNVAMRSEFVGTALMRLFSNASTSNRSIREISSPQNSPARVSRAFLFCKMEAPLQLYNPALFQEPRLYIDKYACSWWNESLGCKQGDRNSYEGPICPVFLFIWSVDLQMILSFLSRIAQWSPMFYAILKAHLNLHFVTALLGWQCAHHRQNFSDIFLGFHFCSISSALGFFCQKTSLQFRKVALAHE